VLGLLVLLAMAPEQRGELAPVALALLAGGVAPRLVRHGRERLDEGPEFRDAQARWARRTDALGPLLVLATVALIVLFTERGRQRLEDDRRAALDGPPVPTSACARDPHGPGAAEVALFLVADAQVHDLGGGRYPGQIALADIVVRSATRPVEQNVLAAAPACQPLLAPASTRPCEDLQAPMSLVARLRALGGDVGPTLPGAIRAREVAAAHRLMTCLCRDGRCQPPPDPLTGEAYAGDVAALYTAHRDEVLCLSWAASARQAHKEHGMTMAEALRCAFRDATLPAARETVATLDEGTCP
jgi:hypothetical protein